MHDSAWMTCDPAGRRPMTRREALKLLGASLTAPLFSGCATSPITGETIFVGMSEAEADTFQPKLVYVDGNNRITHTNNTIPTQAA